MPRFHLTHVCLLQRPLVVLRESFSATMDSALVPLSVAMASMIVTTVLMNYTVVSLWKTIEVHKIGLPQYY